MSTGKPDIIDKVLVAFSTYNAPSFLGHLISTIDRFDPGYDCDILVLDHCSTDDSQLRLLDKISSRYRVETRPNLGRAQGGYEYAWKNNPNYRYYFFLHDDSSIIRDNWLLAGIHRIEDTSLEPELQHPDLADVAALPVGKVGYQAYRWGTNESYLENGRPCIFNYIRPLANQLHIPIPRYYQHIGDDRILLKNELLQAAGHIANLEDYRDENNREQLNLIDSFFSQKYPGNGWIQPRNTYFDADWDGVQTTCEFLNDIMAMRYGYRTHCLLGPGYSQEDIGWSSFWGSEYVNHFGAHSVFKRLSLLLKMPEEMVRFRYRERSFLALCDTLIRKETDAYFRHKNQFFVNVR